MTSTQDRPASLKRRVARVWREFSRAGGQEPARGPDELSRGRFAIGEGVLALEISADLHPVSPASSKSVIAQIQFYDAAGKLMDVAPPQLRHSEKVGGYFYPYDYVQGDAFRFVVPSPDGAARAEVVVRHWRKLDTTP